MESSPSSKQTNQQKDSGSAPLIVNQDKYITKFDENKKTLVLDLDKTLVYLTLEAPPKGSDYSTVFDEEGKFRRYAIKRPGLERFIKEMRTFFNICIVTSMPMKHSIKAVEAIGLDPYVFEVYSRDECVKVSENIYMKSLLKLGFDLSTTIFMDDSSHHMRSQPLNGILVQAFTGEKNDRCFELLTPFLRYIATHADVRPVTEKLYAYFESGIKDSQKKKLKKGKSDSKNMMSQIAEVTEDDEDIQRENEIRKRKKSFSANVSFVNKEVIKEFDFESKSAGASLSQSKCSSLSFGSDQGTDSFLSSLELTKTSSLKSTKQVSAL